VEKAILQSDLGLTPINDGNVIRLPIPKLTEERRKELTRLVRSKAEEGRVAMRNIRRDAIDDLRSFEKEGEITKDDLHRGQEEVQKLTDRFIGETDEMLKVKEKELMEV
jgi:ribosome recycling factor